MLLLNCALKLVEEIILYYDARSKKHQITLCVFKNRRLRRVFGAKRCDIIGGGKRMDN